MILWEIYTGPNIQARVSQKSRVTGNNWQRSTEIRVSMFCLWTLRKWVHNVYRLRHIHVSDIILLHLIWFYQKSRIKYILRYKWVFFKNCVSGGRANRSFYLQREMNLIGWSVPIYRIAMWLAVVECNSSVLVISGDVFTSSSVTKFTKENVTDQNHF